MGPLLPTRSPRQRRHDFDLAPLLTATDLSWVMATATDSAACFPSDRAIRPPSAWPARRADGSCSPGEAGRSRVSERGTKVVVLAPLTRRGLSDPARTARKRGRNPNGIPFRVALPCQARVLGSPPQQLKFTPRGGWRSSSPQNPPPRCPTWGSQRARVSSRAHEQPPTVTARAANPPPPPPVLEPVGLRVVGDGTRAARARAPPRMRSGGVSSTVLGAQLAPCDQEQRVLVFGAACPPASDPAHYLVGASRRTRRSRAIFLASTPVSRGSASTTPWACGAAGSQLMGGLPRRAPNRSPFGPVLASSHKRLGVCGCLLASSRRAGTL